MAQLFANNATTKLAASINSSVTTLTVTAGTGALFPNPTGGNYFLLTLVGTTSGAETSWEIVRVTARSTDTFTIVRAQESTTAASWATDTKAEARLTADSLSPISTGSFSVVVASNGIVVNSQTVAASYTIAAGSSGMSSGPVTIASGQSVTVSSGSRWVVV
jgi:hypothetical protein